MSYAEIDLAMVPAAAPTLKNHRATSCPAPISARTPYHKGFKFTSRACEGKGCHRVITSCYAFSMAQTSVALSATYETRKHQPLQLSWKRLTQSAYGSKVSSTCHWAHTASVEPIRNCIPDRPQLSLMLYICALLSRGCARQAVCQTAAWRCSSASTYVPGFWSQELIHICRDAGHCRKLSYHCRTLPRCATCLTAWQCLAKCY